MIDGKTIGVLIPCYNEEEGLPYVLQAMPSIVDVVYVIDNQSDDNTAGIAHQFGAIVLKQPIKGYGAAYHMGLKHIQTDIVVTMDGDGTYPVDEIPKLAKYLLDNQLDFLSACRFPLQNPQNMDILSKIGNIILTFTTKLLFNYPIKDSQSGMWVFHRSILAKLNLKSMGMAFSEEIKIESLKKRLAFQEVHIPYYKRFGKKKIKKFQDGIINLVYLFYLKFRK